MPARRSSQFIWVWLAFPWILFAILSGIYLAGALTVLASLANEFIITLRIARGEVPLRDVETVHGFISYFFYAFLFNIFSPSLTILKVMNLITIAFSLGLTQSLALRFSNPAASALACAAFLIMCCFGDVTTTHLYPYSLTGLQGVFLLLLVLYSFARYQDDKKAKWIAVAGLSVGYLGGCKVEAAFAAGVVFLLWLFIEIFFQQISVKDKLRRLVLGFISCAAIPIVFYSYLILSATPSIFMLRIQEIKDMAGALGFQWMSWRFYTGLVVILGIFGVGAWVDPGSKRSWFLRASLLAFPALAFAFCYTRSNYDLLFALNNLVILFSGIFLAVHFSSWTQAKDRFLIYAGILSILLHLRVIAGHMATAIYTLHLPYLFALIASVRLLQVKSKLLKWSFAGSWIIALAFAGVSNARSVLLPPSFEINTPWGYLRVLDTPYFRAMSQAAEKIRAETHKDEKIYAAPMAELYFLSGRLGCQYEEDGGMNWFLKVRTPEGRLRVEKNERALIEKMEKEGVKLAALDLYSNKDLGYGEKFGENIYRWVLDRFILISAYPIGDQGINIYRREN